MIVNDLSSRVHAVVEFRNSPDAESIHPSHGAVVIPPVLRPADTVAIAQAVQAGVLPLKQNELAAAAPRESFSDASMNAADLNDETYRPRLSLKPGSCKIPLPPLPQ